MGITILAGTDGSGSRVSRLRTDGDWTVRRLAPDGRSVQVLEKEVVSAEGIEPSTY
jgi:hypothetical protein